VRHDASSDSDVVLWRSALLAREPGLTHGVTVGDYNMALTTGPDTQATPARRRRACEALGVSFDRLTVGEQVHGARAAIVTGSRIGCGRDTPEGRIAGADGLLTDEVDVPLMVLSADCCVFAVYDPIVRAVGVAHAGWRGSAGGIVRRLIASMNAAFACRSMRMIAAIGPCAGACCYKVREDVVSTFAAAGHDTREIVRMHGGAMYLDLEKSVRLKLEECGVQASHIDAAGICTICSGDFYSYRGEGRMGGQFALIAGLVA